MDLASLGEGAALTGPSPALLRFPIPKHACVWMQLSGPGLGYTSLTSGFELTEPARVNSILVSANSRTFVEEYEQC